MIKFQVFIIAFNIYFKPITCSESNFLRTVTGAQLGIFQGRRGLLQRGHLDKHFIYNTLEKSPLE